ncbi:hypothetical protein Zmor_028502 [Zophobas morio]|uniref:60S ribosomal protein L18a n=1 Tax=Zophobas morio TaxID=2755281 RepID=A0AA38HJM9_9CUCU|nr:hypothetical protein Zmor_028502 [Zophobas morio]
MPFSTKLHEYQVVGRKRPTDTDPKPKLYRMRLFSPNPVIAKSRFWYFLKKVNKVKKMTGEIVSCIEIFEKKPDRVKNYSIFLRYDSRSGTHNIYKEFRDITATGAVAQCYQDLAARHRCRARSIHIIRVDEIPAGKCRRPQITQFHDSKLKFPLPHRVIKRSKEHKSKFIAKRPCTYYK